MGSRGLGVGFETVDLGTSVAPHSPQNFSPAVYGVLQAVQFMARRLPHSTQNLQPAWFSTPHDGQFIGSHPPFPLRLAVECGGVSSPIGGSPA